MKKVFFISALLLFSSCNQSVKQEQENVVTDTTTVDSTVLARAAIRSQQTAEDSTPVWGYRFIITGDFDGDHKKEKLTEHFYDGLTKKETNKFYKNLDYDQTVAMSVMRNPYSFALSDNKKIDTLHISSRTQLFGVSYMKNEGDLNGDGTDEVSYVIDWADWSNLNTWHIVTYKNKKWQELYSFRIWDWQLPSLPESSNQYGLFGTEDKIIIASDTLNQRIAQELLTFKGLVKKIKINKIQVTYRTDESMEDSMVIDLKTLPRKK